MAQQKSRLGRGLDSLVSVESPAAVVAAEPVEAAADLQTQPGSLQYIPVSKIQPNPQQPRSAIDPQELVGLVDSLRTSGLLQPILVRRQNDTFQLIAGERRWRAAGQAGLQSIPAIVREANEQDMLEVALIENIQRSDLNPMDRAAAYAAYLSRLSVTQDQASHRLGQDRTTIANYIRLLELDKHVREMVAGGTLSMGHARALLGIADPLEQRRLAKLITKDNLSVRRAETLVRQANQAEPTKPRAVEELAKQANLREVEDTLSRRLNRKVRIQTRGKGDKGQVVISFENLDEFDELVARLCQD